MNPSRRRAAFPDERTPRFAQPAVATFVLRPSRWVPFRPRYVPRSELGEQPRQALTVPAIAVGYLGAGRRFHQTGPAAAGFQAFGGDGRPPVGNFGRNFGMRPPRRTTRLLPVGLPDWQPRFYGEDGQGAEGGTARQPRERRPARAARMARRERRVMARG